MIDVKTCIDSLKISTTKRHLCNLNFANRSKVQIENLAMLGANIEAYAAISNPGKMPFS